MFNCTLLEKASAKRWQSSAGSNLNPSWAAAAAAAVASKSCFPASTIRMVLSALRRFVTVTAKHWHSKIWPSAGGRLEVVDSEWKSAAEDSDAPNLPGAW